jgi:hypothetical protein
MSARGRMRVARGLFVACGAWLIGLGIYFIFLRPALLPEDIRYIGIDIQAMQSLAPGLSAWLGKVFTVLGGFMAGAGVLVAYIGWQLAPLRPRGLALASALSGSITVGLMSAVNFALGSDFRWLLLAPPLAWAVAVGAYLKER